MRALIGILVTLLMLESGEPCRLVQYSGAVALTNGGRTCQRWADQVPHQHVFNSSSLFPLDDSIEAAENYCRQVAGDSIPWCLTTDKYKRWQYCDAVICENGLSCGGILTSSEGFLASIDRNGDGVYDSDLNCLWTLVAPEHKQIKFQVINFEMEHHLACWFDFLKIYESDFTHGVFCGTEVTSVITSRSETLLAQFYSDRFAGYSGFTANYSHVDAVSGPPVDNSQRTVPYGDTTCPAGVDLHLYAGDVHTTNSGNTCKNWTDVLFAGSPKVYNSYFNVDGSALAAKNYCRNLLQDAEILPWCVAVETETHELCYAQICPAATTTADFTTAVKTTRSSSSSPVPASSTVNATSTANAIATVNDSFMGNKPSTEVNIATPQAGSTNPGHRSNHYCNFILMQLAVFIVLFN